MTQLFGYLLREPIQLTKPASSLFNTSGAEKTAFQYDTIGLYQSAGNIASIKDYVIAYTGYPVWSNSSLASLARARGHGEAILAAYLDGGNDFLRDLNGEFSLAIVHRANNSVFLANDRMGVHRLVYSDLAGFSFSDSIHAIKKYSEIDYDLSPQAIYDYIYFHMIPSPGSVYQGIAKLGPAQFLVYENGKINVEDYWQPVFSENVNVTQETLAEELSSLLADAVGQSIRHDAVGAFLSGGLDSTTVSAFLSKQTPTAKTYTIGFDAEGYDETAYARIASDHFGTQQHEYYVTPADVIEAIPKIAEAYDEPFGNSSALPAYYCAKYAKQDGRTLLLAGDGGDEIFAGNERYAKQKVFDRYFLVPLIIRKVLEAPFGAYANLKNFPLLKKAYSYIQQANTSLPDRLETYNFLHQNLPGTIFSRDFIGKIDTSLPIAQLRQRYNFPETASNLNRMLYLDWKRTLADNDIRKVNEMCKLGGIEVTYPMLDDKLVEFSCRIPSNLKIKGFELRYFYKYALRNLLPTEILNKSKHGFGLPFGVWMRTHPDLQELAYGSIKKLKKRQYFNGSFLDETIQLHRDGHASYYGELIWVLMMLELWLSFHEAS